MTLICLNPFFFRSESHQCVSVEGNMTIPVLIPFSSGQNPIDLREADLVGRDLRS